MNNNQGFVWSVTPGLMRRDATRSCENDTSEGNKGMRGKRAEVKRRSVSRKGF